MRSSPTGEIVLQGCRVPAANLVGTEGGAIRPMMQNLEIERVCLAAISLGIARACLDQAVRYAAERTQFGQPIIRFQAVSHKIADMHIHHRAATSLVYDAAQAVDAPGERARMAAAAAKVFAAETAMRTALDAIQILGGYGYIREFPVERLARDAKLLEIGGGTSEILRNLIVSELEGNPRAR
jgi:isovaleryl-CoA dehydrogenase